ncbi:MAG: Signal transduction histidine kinase regulating citrate/malate metabolism [Firmicutes bacterium]|nr:Signal transduction histidine kinase regulating citrate/malate metabolism [Bacillota bacterium]
MEEREALELLRRQRHSLINHLQVVSGWLQLDRADRARQYLESVAARIAVEADSTRQFPPALALVALALSLDAETYGVAISWQASEPVAALEGSQLVALEAQVSAAVQAASSAPEGARKVEVRIGPGGIAVHTPSDKGEG